MKRWQFALLVAGFWSLAIILALASRAYAACAPAANPMQITARGDTVLATGQIVSGSAAELAVLVATSHPRRLVIDSNGGAVGEAAAMAATVRVAGLEVAVPRGMCASACFMVLAAGRERAVGPETRIGVHRAAVCGDDAQFGTDVEASLAVAFGVPVTIVRRMVETRQPDMAWLTRAELASMGVRFAAAP